MLVNVHREPYQRTRELGKGVVTEHRAEADDENGRDAQAHAAIVVVPDTAFMDVVIHCGRRRGWPSWLELVGRASVDRQL